MNYENNDCVHLINCSITLWHWSWGKKHFLSLLSVYRKSWRNSLMIDLLAIVFDSLAWTRHCNHVYWSEVRPAEVNVYTAFRYSLIVKLFVFFVHVSFLHHSSSFFHLIHMTGTDLVSAKATHRWRRMILSVFFFSPSLLALTVCVAW